MNLIPERSRMHVSVRAPRDSEMHELKDKVLKIIHASASSTGCEVSTGLEITQIFGLLYIILRP